jgi:uncharacterized glyoxalase superfamily protein PhnB
MAARNKTARKKPAKKTTKKAASRRPTARKAVKKSAKKGAKRSAPKRRLPETLRFRSVSPGLTVNDLQKSIAWYRDVAGFYVGEMWKAPDGTVRGAEIMAGAARFYLGQDDWAKGRDRKKGEGFRLNLTTAQSVDEIATGIKQRGGKLDSEPADMPWGSRAFALTDPDGFKLTISSGD